MRARLLLALLAAAALAAPAAVPAQPSPAAQQDWTRNVVRTPEGGFRMGNPNAPVKLVEYLSLTCPHCAHFAEEGTPRLINDYVRSGRVSIEYRNYVLNPFDLAASLISRCAPPQDYFALNHAILAARDEWVARLQNAPAEQRQQLQGLSPLQAMQRIVGMAGLDAIAARHGITPAAAQACLTEQANLDRIVQMRQAADQFGVTGTPSFAINGRLVEANDWASLEPLLRAGG